MQNLFIKTGMCLSFCALIACGDTSKLAETAEIPEIAFEKFTLDNGLDVVLHTDRSDPVVAINLAVHVGSARETEGRTGFAHLFEHLLFLDSENLGYGGLDEMNTRIGGEGTNGFTTHDMTQYFQAVPKDGLEKIIWAEADKLGWFIKTVTQPVIDNEKQVVKNEKRQRVDNVPYGHNLYIINKALYPEDHPYNWQVIGSLADLDAATLQDVKDFYGRWYVPNNVTVTLSGDFDPDEAKALVEKYFGEIPKGPDVERQTPRAAALSESLSLYHEDNFATVPQLTMVWPAVEQFHPDSYALEILSQYLTDGKRAPLNEVLVDEEQLTSDVSSFQYTKELSGEFYLFVSAKDGGDIDALVPAIDKAFARFEQSGIAQADLDRIKAGLEVDFYSAIQSALGKAIQLGEYNLFTGDPGFIREDIRRISAVTPEDVMRVYETYIKDKPRLYTSFVPKGELELKLDTVLTPQKAKVVEEPIVQGAEAESDFDPYARTFEPTPSSFDRSVEPPFGPPVTIESPKIWTENLENGLTIRGIENAETPLIFFKLYLPAGQNRGDIEKPAIARLTAAMMEKGTASKTTAELEDAIKGLGSSISFDSGPTATTISGSALARNFDATLALAGEMLLQPRWDAAEFELLIAKTRDEIDSAEGDPGYLSRREWAKINYPPDHIYSQTSAGPKDKLADVSLQDLKDFHARYYAPNGAYMSIAGDISVQNAKAALQDLSENWTARAPEPAQLPLPRKPELAELYFYDVPEAKQTVLRFGGPSIAPTHPDFAAADAMNYLLGNIYTSRLMTELRVNKGYTYGIRSGFYGQKDRGEFTVRSSVRANVTLESTQLIRDILSSYGKTFSDDDLAVMKSALIKGQALSSETLNAKLDMLGEIGQFGYADDYRAQNAEMIENMTLADIQRLTTAYLRPGQMYYLFVGDAATQLGRLDALGYGEPKLLNP